MQPYTNKNNYGMSIAVWLASDTYDQHIGEKPYISATALLKPIRIIVLSKRIAAMAGTDIAVEPMDIDRLVASSMGTALHDNIETAWKQNYRQGLRNLGIDSNTINLVRINPTDLELSQYPDTIPVYIEQRVTKEINGYIIGGKYDFIGDGTLEDFKSMGVYSFLKGDKDDEQRKQGSIYRWLNPDIIKKDYMLIQHLLTDWSKLDAMIKKGKGYPQKRIMSKKLQLMSLEDTEAWILDRLNTIISLDHVPEAELPECTKEELWQDDTIYKYYKNPLSTKRSTGNYDNSTEAFARLHTDGDVGIVKEIHGKIKRCGYCPAFEICTQKDAYKEQGILQMP